MTSANAIKEYFSAPNSDGTQRPVTNVELMALRKGTSGEEWSAMGKACAEALGQPWDAPKE